MMKLFEHNTAREAVEHAPETHTDLPELPADVEVPDDIRGLTHAEARPQVAGVRWMRWLVIAIPLMIGAIVLAMLVRSDSSDPAVPDDFAAPALSTYELIGAPGDGTDFGPASTAPALGTYELIGAPGDGTGFGPGSTD